MKIRKATKKDISEIINLLKEYEKYMYKIDNSKNPWIKRKKNIDKIIEKDILQVIKSKNDDIVVAEIDKSLVGFIWFSKEKPNWIHKIKSTGKINYMFVLPKFRGKSISSKLKNETLKWFKKNQVKWIGLNVHNNNPKSHKIYKKWGFEDYEIEMWKSLK